MKTSIGLFIILLGVVSSTSNARLDPSHKAKHKRHHHYHKKQHGSQSILPKKLHHKGLLGGNTRIVGGTPVSGPGVYPFFASWEEKCGATLVHSDIVLSAAHCNSPQANTVTINAFRLGDNTTEGAETRTIVERSVHPQYHYDSVRNDFILLQLDLPVTTVTPLAINTDLLVPQVGQALNVIGLGQTKMDTGEEQDGELSDVLLEVNVTAVSDEVCSDLYEGEIDEDSMLCAGVNGGGKDSCHGDSGGPLFTFAQDGTPDKQVGVVSWGYGCALPNYPGVYAEVSSASDWIQFEICRLSADTPSYCPVPDPMIPTLPPSETSRPDEYYDDYHDDHYYDDDYYDDHYYDDDYQDENHDCDDDKDGTPTAVSEVLSARSSALPSHGNLFYWYLSAFAILAVHVIM